MELRDRTVLVTGGAVRIGAAISRALARAGMRVVVHYNRSGREAEALCAELRAMGREAFAVRGDLADAAACDRIVAEAIRCAGPLDVLVNNAAIFEKDTLDDLDPERLHRQFQINFFAPLRLMCAFAAQRRPGVIVNIVDRRITGLDPAAASYELSKKALAEATRLAAKHWAPRLRVHAVAPGPVLPPPGESPDYMREKAGPIPLQRICSPEEVAEAVRFLIAADGMTGQVLFVDGGQHLIR